MCFIQSNDVSQIFLKILLKFIGLLPTTIFLRPKRWKLNFQSYSKMMSSFNSGAILISFLTSSAKLWSAVGS